MKMLGRLLFFKGTLMKNFLTFLVISTSAMGLFAQEPPPNRGPEPGQILGRFFGFDEAQITTLQALFETRRTSLQPIEEEVQITNQALRDLLNGENPDPTAVGELVIQEKALREQVGSVFQTFTEGFSEMLTEEQSQKYAALSKAERLIPVVEAAHAIKLPLLPPPPPEEVPE